MSVTVVLQALGWVSVVWLVVVYAMVQRGRLPGDGRAYRIAGSAAAASVVAASVAEEIWPVAVLGLLWLRTEVFGHRHHLPHDQAAPGAPDQPPARMPELLVGALARGVHQVPHPHPHLPHPHLARRTVDWVFRVEMGIVITVVV